MPKFRHLSPQSVWDLPALKNAFEEAGVLKPNIHAIRLLSYLIRNPSADLKDVPELPKAALMCLERYFTKFTSSIASLQRSGDGETVKLLLQLQDGLRVEAVVMQHDTRNFDIETGKLLSGRLRSTLCVSSQVGCQMGCKFCATGTMGLKGNLTIGEIVEQIAYARQFSSIRNIVFMGMGEPLHNYNAVKEALVQEALAIMTDSRLFSLSQRHVTVSTVGVTDRIRSIASDIPMARLAISLHAPSQKLRESIVPSARVYKLPSLMLSLQHYLDTTGGRAFVEYVMLRGVNDEPHHACELGDLLRGMAVTVNLIPWNPILSPGVAFEAPEPERAVAPAAECTFYQF